MAKTPSCATSDRPVGRKTSPTSNVSSIVSLVVSDDGVGFEANRLATPGGLGLITMREPATQLNGKFEFESAPGRGTTMRVVIPFR